MVFYDISHHDMALITASKSRFGQIDKKGSFFPVSDLWSYHLSGSTNCLLENILIFWIYSKRDQDVYRQKVDFSSWLRVELLNRPVFSICRHFRLCYLLANQINFLNRCLENPVDKLQGKTSFLQITGLWLLAERS